jgi:hypothetical protein
LNSNNCRNDKSKKVIPEIQTNQRCAEAAILYAIIQLSLEDAVQAEINNMVRTVSQLGKLTG